MFPPSPQCSVPARYARLHYALGGGGKETKTTTNILTKVPNSFQDLTWCAATPSSPLGVHYPQRRSPLLLWKRLEFGHSEWVNPKGCQRVAGGRRGFFGAATSGQRRSRSPAPRMGCQTVTVEPARIWRCPIELSWHP